MPYEKINTSVRALDVLAKTIATPRDYKASRIPTFPALERTGVLSFTDTQTVTVSSEGSSYAMVCRDPAYPVWHMSTPVASPFSVYTMFIGSADLVTCIANEPTDVFTPPIANIHTNTSLLTGSAGAYKMPIISYLGERYFYNATGRFAVELSFAAVPGATIATVSLVTLGYSNDLSNSVIYSPCVVTGSSAGFSIGLPTGCTAFRCVGLQIQTANLVNCNSAGFGITSDTASATAGLSAPVGVPPTVLFPITKPTEAYTTVIPWKSVRATSVGSLFSNVTAVMSKEGTVSAARVNTESISAFYTAGWRSAMNSVYPKDRYFGAMENGLYTFTLPDSGAELYRDVTVTVAGDNNMFPIWAHYQCPCGNFDLDKLAYANIIIFDDIGTVDTTLAVTVDRHIEFRSSSVLFPLGFSNMQLESYHSAQMALVQLGVFFENPTHLGLIASAVSQALRTVATYAYPVAKQVGKAALAAAGDTIINMASKKFGQMSQKSMVKTAKPQPKRTKRKVKVVIKRRK